MLHYFYRGYVESQSEVRITLKKKIHNELFRKEKGVFFLKNTSIELLPNKEMLFDVFFEPNSDGLVYGDLVIHIRENPNALVIPLKGYGMVPALTFHDETLSFNPILPNTINCEKLFTIENTSTFPVELYFADFDM